MLSCNQIKKRKLFLAKVNVMFDMFTLTFRKPSNSKENVYNVSKKTAEANPIKVIIIKEGISQVLC